MANKPVYVTKPSLAPLEDCLPMLQEIWESGILTNNGPFVLEFEKQLASVLNIKKLVSVTNGTLALQLAIRALNLKGEIITTPFTWIATLNSIIWEQCTPVFVDIDPLTFNIDPQKIEQAITSNTSAILGVHVFSNPCDTDAIETLAERYSLKVIYDAAHCMGVTLKGQSIFSYGDISTLSLHATKLLNAVEGGACFAKSLDDVEKLKELRFFGYNHDKRIVDIGTNGKMSEVHAAIGLANLKHLPFYQKQRIETYNLYKELLTDCHDIRFQTFDPEAYNYTYVPVVFQRPETVLNILDALNQANIYPRRYFHPSLNTIKALTPYRSMPVSEKISNSILCLPSFTGITQDTIEQVCSIIKIQLNKPSVNTNLTVKFSS